MIIFIIHPSGIRAIPLECDSIVTGHPNTVARWIPMQYMETKSWNIHVPWSLRGIQGVQTAQAAGLIVEPDSSASSRFKQLLQTFMTKCLYHGYQCNPADYTFLSRIHCS